jgi:hypothetical protein
MDLKHRLILLVIFALAATAISSGPLMAQTRQVLDDDATLVAVDEAAPESDPNHNSDANADLTYMYAWLAGAELDTLVVTLDFASTWSDLHLMIILERNGDADGAARDAFDFPVNYGHTLKPDYVFTLKYSSQDYADLRRWRLGQWEFWRPSTHDWTTNPNDANKNSLSLTRTTDTRVQFRFPADAIGPLEPQDLLRLEAYVTQEPQGVKYTALDSTPQDDTHDMVPATGNWWDTATQAVTLSHYADFRLPEFGAAPALSDAAVYPDTIISGDQVLASVRVVDAGGGIGEVDADLSALRGGTMALVDDGTGGDEIAGDGIYSALFTTAGDLGGGIYAIDFSASDTSGVARNSLTTTLVVESEGEVFISVEDAEGDDHGPNHEGVAGLYYRYPTNRVFKTGVFDITGADFVLNGRNLAIRIHIKNVLSSTEVGWGAPKPGARCGNPNKAELDLPKIDIYADASEGEGATVALPARYVDIASRDAWEFAINIDGWVVELITSNGSNSSSDWARNRTDIYICDDYVEEYVDVIVDLEALGLLLPTETLNQAKRAQIQQELKQWDFIITMESYDGYSPGTVRTVNKDVTEYYFSGGSNAVGGREPDPNLIDLLTIPGQGRVRGHSQEYMLDYTTDEAQARFASGLNSCVVEATPEFSGAIGGTVTLSDSTDETTVATVTASVGGVVYGSAETPPGGGAYKIEFLPDGTYDVTASAHSYRPETTGGVVVSGGGFEDGYDFTLTLVTGAISGTVTLSGPEADARVYVRDDATGVIAGDSAIVIEDGDGPFEFLIIEDGIYHVVAEARGYARFDSLVTISHGDTATAEVVLTPAVATRYVFVDSMIDVAHATTFDPTGKLGNEIYSRSVSRSIPSDDIYFFSELLFEPRDDEWNSAVFDFGALDSVTISLSQLDTSVPPRGNVILADSPDPQSVIPEGILTSDMFENGVGRFFLSGDSIEVLRVEAAKGSVTGAVEVGIGELKPAKVSLVAERTETVVGEEGRVEVAVQVVDVRGNKVPQADIPIRMQIIEGTAGFEPEVDNTDANGFFRVFISTTVSGDVRFSARAEPGPYESLPADTVEVHFSPGDAHEFTARLVPPFVQKNAESNLKMQLVDIYGNSVNQADVRIDVSAYPLGLLKSVETPVYTDAGGAAEALLKAGDRFGIATIGAVSAYPVPSLNLTVDASLVAVDEEAPESDPQHNSNPNVDLTTMFAALHGDTLTVSLDFSSSWGDVLMVVILETNRDAAGASQDAFQQPIFYRHTLKPDYVFTTKYSSNDYADLRRWHGDGYQYWNLAGASWIDQGGDEKNAIGMVTKTDERVYFHFPLGAVGQLAPGDTVRMEAYVTQETASGVKYNALDSTPADATNDMEPPTGNWWDAENQAPTTLSKYGLFVIPEEAVPPTLTQAKAVPDSAEVGDDVRFSVRVEDAGGGIGNVYSDLSGVFGDAVTRLNDSGTGGDITAGDGVYSTRFTIPSGVPQGSHAIAFIAKDSLNIAESRIEAMLKITTPPDLILSVADSVGDDHGPNQTDRNGNPVEGLYYYYPTNGVFSPGVFDIKKLDVFIDGAFLVLRVYVGEIPSSEAVGWNAPNPGITCTNPNKADLNLQKVDVYIDTKEGSGATAGLPFRYVDISANDAWEYAVAIEGWYRALIESNGQNSISFWTLLKQTNQIDFCDDQVQNYIDIKIALSVLGDPSVETIKKWDFIVTLASHDGDSNDQNLGGSRWVNQATSEWQFGGGRDGEAGRERDANIIDVVTIVGEGKEPGRSQEQMLDYLTPDALSRFANNKTAVVLEASFSEDISPPVITPFATDGFAHNVWYVMEYAPASFWTTITDQSSLKRVEFYWRPLGSVTVRKIDMVNLTGDYWIADIEPEELRSTVSPVELVDGTLARPFEAWIEAEDEFGNSASSPLFTFAIPDENLKSVRISGLAPGGTAVVYDGTVLALPETWTQVGVDHLDFVVTPLGLAGTQTVDISGARPSMTYRDVARRIELVIRAGESPFTGYEDGFAPVRFPKPVTLTLHYPSYDEPGDQKKIGLFNLEEATNRWVTLFGQVNERGNAVTADVRSEGVFALFTDSRLGYDLGEGLSGVLADPNPFSPNGDGLYDETRIGFFLSREADWVSIEIYDVAGTEVRTIRWQQGLTTEGRNSFEIAWDGKDDGGKIVPYGIYVARIEVRFKVAPYNERKNIPLVVIK